MNFIVDKKMPEVMVNNLKKYGKVYPSIEVNTQDKSINSHPDLQIHFISDKTVVTAPEVYEYYKSILPHTINIEKGISNIGFTYPKNCAYNIVRLGMTIICNTMYAEKTILDYYNKNGYRIINVKQGYTKCNVCPIADDAFITEDSGICKTVRNTAGDIKVYLLFPGSVRLDGFEYGFIGGASGRCGENILLCGSVPKTEELKKIIDKTNLKIITLSEKELYDFGSIISF